MATGGAAHGHSSVIASTHEAAIAAMLILGVPLAFVGLNLLFGKAPKPQAAPEPVASEKK